MPRLCQFANILGRPREGMHSLRIPYLDWAVTDTLLTVLLALALGSFLGPWGTLLSTLFWFVVLLLLVRPFSHWLFCVNGR